MKEFDPREFYQLVGSRIRQKRHETGIHLANLAVMMNLSVSSIIYIEQGKRKPNLHTVYLLAHVFGCGVEELLSGEVVEESEELHPPVQPDSICVMDSLLSSLHRQRSGVDLPSPDYWTDLRAVRVGDGDHERSL